MAYIRLAEMPFDKSFSTDNGEELCHATGYAYFDGNDWWYEYVDSTGYFHYGR